MNSQMLTFTLATMMLLLLGHVAAEHCAPRSFDLVATDSTIVGIVSISNTESTLMLHVVANGDWALSAINLAGGNGASSMTDLNGFPYKRSFSDIVTETTFVIDMVRFFFRTQPRLAKRERLTIHLLCSPNHPLAPTRSLLLSMLL